GEGHCPAGPTRPRAGADPQKALRHPPPAPRPGGGPAPLWRRTPRQVRRRRRRLEAEGAQAVVPRLRGRPSNRRIDPARRQKVLDAYRRDYPDFGPTLASEKLAERGLAVSPETLRQVVTPSGFRHQTR